ncbi:acyltransferase [Streptomyces lavenduligriseus]|nr:acyltransferase [Streptomyces lavenduligriseus]
MPRLHAPTESGEPASVEPATSNATFSRLPSLTGMRFIAALLVFATHISANRLFASRATDDGLAAVLGRTGWLGVSFFFVLSGFILTWSARPADTVRGFWRRRIVKIYPNHLVTLVAALALMAAVGQTIRPSATAANLLLLNTWVPVVDIYDSPNGLSWSLCCELAFYLAFPLLHRLVVRIPSTRLWVWTAAVGLLVIAVPFLARALPTAPVTPWAADIPFWHYWLAYSLPPVRMLEFVLGILVARTVLTGRWAGPGPVTATLLTLAAYSVMTVAPAEFAMAAVPAVPLALLIAAIATADITGAPSPLRSAAMVRLGELSFAFYMVHELIIRYGLRALGHHWSTAGGLALTAGLFSASLGCAWLLHRYVEVPAMRRWGSRRRPAPAAADVPPPRATARQGPAPGPGHSGAGPSLTGRPEPLPCARASYRGSCPPAATSSPHDKEQSCPRQPRAAPSSPPARSPSPPPAKE